MYIMKSRYDEGAADRSLLVGTDPVNPNPLQVRDFYKNVMWVSIPFANGEVLSTDAKIRLRTGRIYDKFATGTTQVNNSNPRYRINLSSVAATKNDAVVAKSALDTIKVVPNPYYAYSARKTVSKPFRGVSGSISWIYIQLGSCECVSEIYAHARLKFSNISFINNNCRAAWCTPGRRSRPIIKISRDFDSSACNLGYFGTFGEWIFTSFSEFSFTFSSSDLEMRNICIFA